MSLKKEIALILLVVIGLFTALDYTVQRFVIYPSYRKLDRSRAREDLQRGLAVLQREILHLDKQVQNWSARDDLLRFMRERNTGFIETNLSPKTFLDNHLNAIFLLDQNGRAVWGRSRKLDDLTQLPLAELPGDALPPGSPLRKQRTAEDSVSGILLTGAGPMLIATRPIIDSGKTGEPLGTLLMGRLMDQEELAAIATQTGVWLTVWSCRADAGKENLLTPVSDSSDCDWQGPDIPGAEDLRAISTIDAEKPVVLREEKGGKLCAYSLFPKVVGAGFMVLKSHSEMPISAMGSDVLHGAMLSLLCVGLLILLVLLEALNLSVLKPLGLLTKQVVALRRNEGNGSHITGVINSQNEIGVLAREFDTMVAQLLQARRQLAERSYHSGMTEMASGVIHNLRNALTPVTANLDLLKEEFHDLPLAQMKMAGGELADPAVSGERREMLVRYLRESLGYLSEMISDIRVRLKNLDAGVVQVEKILGNQEKFIGFNRGGEVIELAQLIREASVLVNLNFHKGLDLRIDPTLEEVGVVVGQRNALLHVFANLINNASEAISRAERRQGLIEIVAVSEADVEPELVHIMIRDNGCGILPDDLSHLFERGYTTKNNSGSGIGLHWCANTVAAMHGRLWAESGGPDRGATLHLMLPKSLP